MTAPSGKCFIGFTTNPIQWRISNLKTEFAKYKSGDSNVKKCVIFDIMDENGCVVTILEHVDVDNKKELYKRTGWWIRNTPQAINSVIPGRTYKEYYQDKKETLRLKDKQKYEKNKEIIISKIKKYQAYKKTEAEKGVLDVTSMLDHLIPEVDVPEPEKPIAKTLRNFFPVEFP